MQNRFQVQDTGSRRDPCAGANGVRVFSVKCSGRLLQQRDGAAALRRRRAALWGIVAVVLLLLMTVQGASAFNSKPHYDLTWDSLRDEGVAEGQLALLGQYNNMADWISKGDEYEWTVDLFAIPDVYSNDEEIEELFAQKAHFQGFNNPDELNAEWYRLQEQTQASIAHANTTGNTRELLITLGMSLHTVQDFYAHSTWSEVTEANGWGDATWFDIGPDVRRTATSGGVFKWPAYSTDHRVTNKDYPLREYYDTSYREAYYASRQWIKLVRSWAGEPFWNRAMSAGADRSGWDSDFNDFFWIMASYAGGWSDPNSKSEDDAVREGLLYWDAHLLDKIAYADLFRGCEQVGFAYLYRQERRPEYLHYDTLPYRIQPVQWLRLRTSEAKQTDCDPIHDIDPGTNADFYSEIIANGHTYREAPMQGRDDYWPEGRWLEWIPLSPETWNVQVWYQLWDDDLEEMGGDEQCDIVWSYDTKTWTDFLFTSSPWTPVTTDGLRGSNWLGWSEGNGNEAKVVFDYEFQTQHAGITPAAAAFTMTASPGAVHSGEPVTYTYSVVNRGTQAFRDVTITDSAGLVPVPSGGDANHNNQVDPGETWTYTATTTITTSDILVYTTATMTAQGVSDGLPVSATDAEVVNVVSAALSVEKTASPEKINLGDQVTYTYTVTNLGNVDLRISIADDKIASLGSPNGDANNDSVLNAAILIGPDDPGAGGTIPAEVWTYTATSRPASSVTNTVTVNGTDPTGRRISAVDTATVTVTPLLWQRCLGGTGDDDAIMAAKQINAVEYALAGYTNSNNGDVAGNHGDYDAWLAKYDSADNSVVWQQCLGGSGFDEADAVAWWTEGVYPFNLMNYAVAGSTASNDGGITGNHGGTDAWVAKTDGFNVYWQRCLGGSGYERATAIQRTADGGFIVAGFTDSNNGDVAGNHGGYDAWVVKLDSTGAKQWQKCLGGTRLDRAYAVQQTSDGGYVIAGVTDSTDGNVTGNHGGTDAFVAKLDQAGTLTWWRCVGGSNDDDASAVLQTSGGAYVMAGSTQSTDGDVAGNHGGGDAWVVWISSTGALTRQRCYGGTGADSASAVVQTSGGGYVIAGQTASTNGDVLNNRGGADAWVAKLTSSGTLAAQQCLGGTATDAAMAVVADSDGNYVVGGQTASTNRDVTGNHGPSDGWIAKVPDALQPIPTPAPTPTATQTKAPPIAAFAATPRSGTRPLSVAFTDQSSGGPQAWLWNFGDGTTSTMRNASHTYTVAGTYTVNLTVFTTGGSDSEVKTNYITVTSPATPPTAGFAANVTSGAAPLTVWFTDGSTGSLVPATWSWSFGDGGTSTDPYPVHTYTAAGTYSVTLTVSNAAGSDAESKTGYITVTTGPSLVTIPGGASVPGDIDHDQKHEDVNGNGRKDFADVVLYFNQMSWIAANEPAVAFDYNGNGRIDFADVVWLFTHL